MPALIRNFLFSFFLAVSSIQASPLDIFSPLKGLGGFSQRHSLALNGTNQKVTFGTCPNAALEYNVPFSLTFWFNWDVSQATDSNEFVLFGNAGNDVTSKGSWFQLYQKKPRLVLYPALGAPSFIDVRGSTVVAGARWYLMGYTYDGSGANTGANMWLNTTKETKATATGSLSASIANTVESFAMGKTDGDGYLHARFDEVTIWNRELVQADFDKLYSEEVPNNLHGLTGYTHHYRFENDRVSPVDTTSTIYDRVGACNGTGVNLTSGSFSTNIPTNFNTNDVVLTANGTSSNVDFGTGSDLQPEKTQPFSAVYWLYLNSIGTLDQSFLGNNPAGSSPGFNIVVNGSATGHTGRYQFELDAITPSEYLGIEGNAGDYTTGVWQCWASTYGGCNANSCLKAYRGGTQISTTGYGSAASLAGTLINSIPMTIASQGNGLQFVNGNYFRVSFWNKELSGSEVTALCGGAHPVLPSVLPSYASNAVADWRFNVVSSFGIPTVTAIDVKGSNNGTVTNVGYQITTP